MEFVLDKQNSKGLIDLLEKKLGYEVTFAISHSVIMDNGSHPDQIGEDFELEVTTILPEITVQIIGNLMYEGYRPEDIVTDDLIGDSRSIKNRTIIFKYKGNDLFDDDHKPEDVSSVKKLRNLVIKQFHPLEQFADNSEFENLNPKNAKEFVSTLLELLDSIK